MSAAVLLRLRDLFLDAGATPEARPARLVAERVAPMSVGVLAPPAEAGPAGAALALALAAAHRAPCALVCRWAGEEASGTGGGVGSAGGAEPGATLAVGAARRLSARLATRGLTVSARGRLVSVVLPAAAAEARAATERAAAAAGEIPWVLVVGGPRPAELDPLLAVLERLVVVPPPDAPAGLEALAVASAAHLGRGTGVLRLPGASAVAGRAIQASGVLLSPALRTAAAAALEGGHDG